MKRRRTILCSTLIVAVIVGVIAWFGYRLHQGLSTPDEDAFRLEVDFDLPKLAATWDFTLPHGQRYGEEELVRGTLTELDRRAAARAAKTDAAVNYGVSDPTADRRRLLKQHPEVAKKLGLAVPDEAATQGTTSP